MKRILFILILLNFKVFSQGFNKVDNQVQNYKFIRSAEQLAQKIDLDFNSDIEKIRAIYTWITLNIKYYNPKTNAFLLKEPQTIVYFDEDDLKRRLKLIDDKIVRETFLSKKGVCNNIALVFNKVCNLLDIENELIKGFVKSSAEEINIVPKLKNHIWNSVKINNHWIYIDATYGISYDSNLLKSKSNYTYFNISKDKLRLTHYPSKSKWVKLMGQAPLNFFSKLPVFSDNFFNYNSVLISPKNGIINSANKKVTIILKNLNPDTLITYKYEGSFTSKKPVVIYKNLNTSIIINKPKKGKFLTLYFNNTSVFTYNVI